MKINQTNYQHGVFLVVFLIILTACSVIKPTALNPTLPSSTIGHPTELAGSTSSTPTAINSPTLPILTTPAITHRPTYIPITPVIQGTQIPESGAVISTENIDRLTLLARWGQGNPADVVYTPDGKYFIVGTSTGLYFYDPVDYSLVHSIETHAAVFHLAVSPDSQVVAAVATDQVLLYRISDWQLVTTIPAAANSADFSPDGNTLVIGITGSIGSPGYLQLFDTTTGKLLSYINARQEAWSVKFSPLGDYIATAGYVTTIWALDGTMTDQQGPYVDDGGQSTCVSFSPNGKFLAEAAEVKLHIWHVLENGRLVIYRNIDIGQFYRSSIDQVAISPDGKLVAASLSRGAGVWDLATGALVFDTSYSYQDNNSLAWSMDSKSFAIASNQPGIHVWDIDAGKSPVSMDLHSGSFSSVAWSSDGQKLAVGAQEGEVDVFNGQNGTVTGSFGSGYRLNSLAFSPDSQTLAVGYWDATVNIWDVPSTISHTLEGVGYGSTDVTFSADGTFFAATTAENYQIYPQVRFWNTRDWTVEKSFSIGNFLDFDITGFALAPDQRTGAISYTDRSSGSWEEKIQIISIADGSVVTTLDSAGYTRSITYSPDGASLAVLVSNSIYIWQTNDWGLLPKQFTIFSSPSLGRPFNLQYSIAWSPDSDLLAVGLQNGHNQVLNVQSGQRVTLTGHTMYVTGVAFSSDGRYLASISLDGTVRLWCIR